MNRDMDSPTGIDIHPEPPAAVRVRRAIGIVAFVAVVVIVAMILYGVYTRQQRQVTVTSTEDLARKAIPATGASQEFTGGGLVLNPELPMPVGVRAPSLDLNRATSPQSPLGPSPICPGSA